MPEPLPDLATIIPVCTVSGANVREHWTTRQKRAKEHREAAYYAFLSQLRGRVRARIHLKLNKPLRIRLTRIAPRALDDDNLRSALKHIRDGVTDALGLSNDRDSRLRWEYEQTKGKPKQYVVSVQIWRVEP